MRRWIYVALFAVVSETLSAQVTDFKVTVDGPQNLFRGNSIYLSVVARDLVGTDSEYVTPSISGLPTGVTPHWVSMEGACCGNRLWRLTQWNALKLTASSAARAGRFKVVVKLRTDGGTERSVTMNLVVLSALSSTKAPASSFQADVPLAQLAQWESRMTSLGAQFCNDTSFETEAHAWFYDGMRVFSQLADYTKSSSWYTCAANLKPAYLDHVISNQGRIGSWRVFPEGLELDYERTGDPASRNAILLMFENGGFVHPTPNSWLVAGAVHWEYSREVAYAINVHLAHERLGYPRHPDMAVLIEQAIGHFDQWFLSRRASYVQPFMVALSAEALIAYHKTTPDPRIPYLLRLAADHLRAHSWAAGSQGFKYEFGDGTSAPTADLNLLIAPLFGWIYQNTADTRYRTWGDEAFNSGVLDGGIWSGKLFNVSYRWSEKYVQWRQRPVGY